MPHDFIDRDDITYDKLEELIASIPKWISVKDGLPEDCKEVIFFSVNDVGSKELMIGHREKGYWTHCCMFYSTRRLTDLVAVTHWMPLPEYPHD